jgi:hypothetical protein
MASKIDPENLIDLQFSAEQFVSDDFETLLQDVIDAQEAELFTRLGSPIFDSVATAIVTQVKRLSLCLCAAELLQLRINRLSGNIDADSATIISVLQEARKEYLREVDTKGARLIATGSAADSGNYAGGVLTTSRADSGIIPIWPVSVLL